MRDRVKNKMCNQPLIPNFPVPRKAEQSGPAIWMKKTDFDGIVATTLQSSTGLHTL